MGGRGAEAYQGTKVGKRRAVACPGDDVGVKTACFKLNLAEACPSIDVGEVQDRGVPRCRCRSRHIDHVTAKSTGILIGLMHARHVIPNNALRVIVQALVQSIIRYCLSVYGACGDTQLHRVQKLLNFSARVISGRRKYDHVRDVLRDLQWLDARQLVRYHRMCMVHATLTSGTPEEIAVTFGDTAQQRYETPTACQHALPRIRIGAPSTVLQRSARL